MYTGGTQNELPFCLVCFVVVVGVLGFFLFVLVWRVFLFVLIGGAIC